MRKALTVSFVLLLVLTTSAGISAKTKISFWHDWSGEGGKAIEAVVQEFNELNSDIEVEVVLTAGMGQKLLTAVAGGAAPDVVLFDRYLTGQFAARGALSSLNEFIISSSLEAEDFFEAAWNETMYQGENFGIPYYVDNKALLYNKKLFAEAGLDPNRPPQTWEELKEYSRQLTKRGEKGELIQVGFVPTWNWASLVHYIWQSSGDVFNEDMTKVIFNNEIGVQALEWIVEFLDMYGGNDELSRLSSGFGAEFDNPFYTGVVAMQSEGPWIYQDMNRFAKEFLERDLGIAPLPKNTEHATIAGGFSLIIPKGAKAPKASWRLIEYLVQKENQIKWALASGTIPSLVEAAYDEQIARDEFWQGFIDNQANGRFRPVHPAFPEIESYIYQAVDSAVHKKETPQEALDSAAKRTQAILDRFNRHFK